MKLTLEEKSWWNTLDLTDKYLSKVFFSLYGSAEQRIKQLYLIKDNQKFNGK